MGVRRLFRTAALATSLAVSSCYYPVSKAQIEQQDQEFRKFNIELEKMAEQSIRSFKRIKEESEQFSSLTKELMRRRFGKRTGLLADDPTRAAEKREKIFSCERGIILPGGLKTRAFVFLQAHEDPFTQEMSFVSARSQLLIYRVLQQLAKKHGVRTVALEGEKDSALLRRSKEEREWDTDFKKIFKRCASDAASKFQSRRPESRLRQNEAEDACLMGFYANGY